MNYRHGFHAGNFADVVKHALLVALLEAFKAKPAALTYVETHAGAGRYDLSGARASKTGEYRDGIARLLAATRLPAALHVYLNLVRALNAKAKPGTLLEYPGSPLLASLLLRPEDRLVLCELQPEEAAELKLEFHRDARVAVHRRDGYAALNALLPPKPRRGLALIDPPFEAQDAEYKLIAHALQPALKRWPTGVYAIWYPIKLRQHVMPFHRWLKAAGVRRVLAAELLVHPDNTALRLNGCGVAIVNTPYKFEKTAEEILRALSPLLAQGRFGSHRVDWLVGD